MLCVSVRFWVVVLELGVSLDSKRERGGVRGEKGLFVPFLGGIAVLSKGMVESFAV